MVVRTRNVSKWRLASVAVVAGLGAYLGYVFGSGYGSSGMTSAFSAMIALSLAIVILIVLVVAAVLIRWKSTNSDPALRSVLRTGALFLAGIGVGWVLTLVF